MTPALAVPTLTVPKPTSNVEIPRGALWEDVLQGIWFAGLVGALLYPSMGMVLYRAGAVSLAGQLRGFVISTTIFLLAEWARTRVASLVVFDTEEGAIHDAVRIGRTVYIQESIAFDQVEALVLSRREKSRVLSDQCGEGEVPVEGRGELVLSSGRVLPISNWVEEESKLPSNWSRLFGKLCDAAELLENPVQEAAEVAPPVWELGRAVVWVLSIGVTAGFLVVFSS